MDLTEQKKAEIYDAFYDHVNMQPKELEDWLETEASRSVGDTSHDGAGSDGDGGESTGHKSGRRIVEIKRTSKDELSDADYQHMNKVVNYIKRHTSQRPQGDVEDTPWRYSLMNWGHDPLKS